VAARDLDIPRPSSNDRSMHQVSSLPALMQDEIRVGALGKILRENPELRGATLPALRSALAAHDGPDGVKLNAATWVVTARVPAGL
jgi:surfactin synthase thioesterase subunit